MIVKLWKKLTDKVRNVYESSKYAKNKYKKLANKAQAEHAEWLQKAEELVKAKQYEKAQDILNNQAHDAMVKMINYTVKARGREQWEKDISEQVRQTEV